MTVEWGFCVAASCQQVSKADSCGITIFRCPNSCSSTQVQDYLRLDDWRKLQSTSKNQFITVVLEIFLSELWSQQLFEATNQVFPARSHHLENSILQDIRVCFSTSLVVLTAFMKLVICASILLDFLHEGRPYGRRSRPKIVRLKLFRLYKTYAREKSSSGADAGPVSTWRN